MNDPGPTATGKARPTVAELRISAAVRCLLAAGLAAGLATVAIITSWGPLHVSTDIVGYPIFAPFNVNNYFTAYYWILIAFPVLTVALFLALTWGARKLGLPTQPRRPFRAGLLSPPAQPPGDSALNAPLRILAVGGRALVVGLSFGLEIAVLINNLWVGIAFGTLLYIGVLAGVATTWSRAGNTARPFSERASQLNALAAPLAIVGLSFVSEVTRVTLATNGVARHYPWFPLWLALPASVAVIAAVVRALRRASPRGVVAIERRVVVWLSGALVLFLLLAALPGDQSPINLFEEGQGLTGGSLVRRGYLPYRDVVLAHGPFFDAVRQVLSWQVFGDTRWGVLAGDNIYFVPLTLLGLYWLAAYLLDSDWALLVAAVVLIIATSLTENALVPAYYRFILWPLILIALGALLRHGTASRAVLFTSLLFAQVVGSPEAALAVPGCIIVIVLFELYNHPPGAPLHLALRRTLYTIATGAALLVAFVILLATQHAVGSFVGYFHALSEGHQLTGGLPFETYVQRPFLHSTFVFEALAPVVGMIAWFFYFASRLLRRDAPQIGDWVATAAALFALAYYQKFLARADGHVVESYAMAVPLLLYVAYTILRELWRAFPRRLRTVLHPLPVNPLSVAIVPAVIVLTWSPLERRVSGAASNMRPAAVHEAAVPRVGYGPFIQGAQARDLRIILDRFLGATGKVYDFTNEPGLLFYILGREPASKYYIAGEAFGADTQRDVIADLRRVRPRIVIYDQSCCGLPSWDQIPNIVRHYEISEYILDHYRPLLRIDGQTLYVDEQRRQPPVPRLKRLRDRTLSTTDLYEPSYSCDWGYAPNYLSLKPTPAALNAATTVQPTRSDALLVTGWAADLRLGRPVREVVAVQRGRILARVRPSVIRSDVAAKFKSPGLTRSGWQITLPVSVADSGGGLSSLHLFGLLDGGRSVPLIWQVPGVLHPPSALPSKLGRKAVGRRVALGYVDQATKRIGYLLTPPGGGAWARYHWLEVDSSGSPTASSVTLSDPRGASGDGHRWIAFRIREGGPRRYLVRVGSCPQWRAFGASSLTLSEDPRLDFQTIRFIP